jgi:hypothetical protein
MQAAQDTLTPDDIIRLIARWLPNYHAWTMWKSTSWRHYRLLVDYHQDRGMTFWSRNRSNALLDIGPASITYKVYIDLLITQLATPTNDHLELYGVAPGVKCGPLVYFTNGKHNNVHVYKLYCWIGSKLYFELERVRKEWVYDRGSITSYEIYCATKREDTILIGHERYAIKSSHTTAECLTVIYDHFPRLWRLIQVVRSVTRADLAAMTGPTLSTI